jgi:hypothetical protein
MLFDITEKSEMTTLELVREGVQDRSLPELLIYVERMKEARKKTILFMLEREEELDKVSEERRIKFDGNKVPLDDTEGLFRLSEELDRLSKEWGRRRWIPELLFDVDSIDADKKENSQYVLDNKIMKDLINDGFIMRYDYFLDSTSLLTIMHFLFDVDSIEADTKTKLRLEAEIKMLKEGFPVGSYQYFLEDKAMKGLISEGYPMGCYHLLESTSLLRILLEKEQVKLECERRIKFLNEMVENVEILIEEKKD